MAGQDTRVPCVHPAMPTLTGAHPRPPSCCPVVPSPGPGKGPQCKGDSNWKSCEAASVKGTDPEDCSLSGQLSHTKERESKSKTNFSIGLEIHTNLMSEIKSENWLSQLAYSFNTASVRYRRQSP